MSIYSDKPLPEQVKDLLGITISNPIGRFKVEGWRHQGLSDVGCFDCGDEYEVFRKHYSTTKGEYEYWALICKKCRSCVGLDEMDAGTKRHLRNWATERVPTNESKLSEKIESTPKPLGGMSPTDEQALIIEAAMGTSDISIEALAGTGKTTTLKMLASEKKNQRGTYVAFNKSIVDEAKSKFPSSVICSTAHGLAYRSVGRDYAKRLHSNQRLSFKEIAEWLEAPQYRFKNRIANHALDPKEVARYAQATVRNFCKSINKDFELVHVEMPKIISVDQESASAFCAFLLPYAKKIWDDILLYQGVMRFSHDYYLKMWQLSEPNIASDFILFDEAQDADPVMLDVINSQKNSQLIYCGDQFQAIYEWRGARNALKMVHVDKHLWLTQSFRFGPQIADEANRFLRILNAPKLVKGLTSVKSKLEELVAPDAVLCRTNAGVISAVLTEQQKGRKVAIIGRTEELVDFAKACQELMLGNRTGHPELAPFPTWESVLAFILEYPDEAQEIKTMVELIQSFGVSRLMNSLNQVVSEEGANVVVSTAHRAKGREWGKVKLHGDYLHVDDMDFEDLRLAYVSVTRAETVLDMTSWDSISPRNLAISKLPETSLKAVRERPPIVQVESDTETPKRGIRERLNIWKSRP